MNEFLQLIQNYAPVFAPIITAIALMIFIKEYAYRGMVPESILAAQVARERDIVEGAKDIENRLEEIVRQLEGLTKKVSEQIGENTSRLSSLERFMSDFISEFNTLNHNFELHRKGVPPTEAFRTAREKKT